MADKVVYLDYYIYLTDRAQVDALSAAGAKIHWPRNDAAGSIIPWLIQTIPLATTSFGAAINETIADAQARFIGNVFAAPDYAATEYATPVVINTAAIEAPCIQSDWITGNVRTNYPTNVDSFEHKDGGWFGISFLFGTTTKFIWRGQFVYRPPVIAVDNAGDAVANPAGIQPLTWADGFEAPDIGEGTAGSAHLNRAASRHADGYGLAFRGGSTPIVRSHLVNEFGAADRIASWERMYIRIRALPSNYVPFWRCKHSVLTAAGAALAITSTGRIAAFNVSSTSVFTQLAATTDAVDVGDDPEDFYKVDIVYSFGASSYLKLFLNGTLVLTVTGFNSNGLGVVGGRHAGSHIDNTGFTDRNLHLDVDTWTCQTVPPTFDGPDFTRGTRIVRAEVKSLSGADWAGDWRTLLQNPIKAHAGDGVTSAVSGAVATFGVRAELPVDADPGNTGVIGFLAVAFGKMQTGADDQPTLAYSSAMGSDDVVLPWTGSETFGRLLCAPSDLDVGVTATPIELTLTKGADTQTTTLYGLVVMACMIGVWGPQDVLADDDGERPPTARANTGIHNSPYPNTAWGKKGTAPLSPVGIVTGTYTGTGDAGQDLTFTLPIHWLWIRRVVPSAATDGTRWFSSMIGAHHGGGIGARSNGAVEVGLDPDFVASGELDSQETRTVVRIAGGDDQVNALAETFQYVGFCDPGMRFLLNGAVGVSRGTADRVTALIKNAYLGEAMFYQLEEGAVTTTAAMHLKTPTHTATQISLLGSAPTEAAVSLGAGTVTTKSAIASTNVQHAFAAFRRDDGIDDVGKVRVLQLVTWTGDGVSPRTLDLAALTTASGRRPLWALAIAHGGGTKAIQRDPSHTGTTSTDMPNTGNAANGIRGGGVDQMIVGSDLNANGVTYSAFILPGGDVDDITGNAGWSSNDTPEFFPVAPAVPPDWPGDLNPDFLDDEVADDADEDADDGSSGGGGAGGTGTDLATGCLAYSTQICNRALGHIGITKQILNLDTEETVEAEQCRLVYGDEVDAVLRDFPWAFATKYATLTLVAGSFDVPFNDDWVFKYRHPSDCVFARRIVKAGMQLGRTFDPAPEPFKLSVDTTGKVLYANYEDAQLEYTFRPSCAASAGDALFRDALTWRLAAALAPALARNKVTATDCMRIYAAKLNEAMTATANEQQFPDSGTGDAEWHRGR